EPEGGSRASSGATVSTEVPIESLTAAVGSAVLQEPKVTTACRGTPSSSTFRRASSRKRRTTPALSSELFPTPLAPYSTEPRYARRLSTTISVHVSRPKNQSASASEYGTRPW